MKTCTSCSRELPDTSEYFAVRTDQGGRLRARCRDCMRVPKGTSSRRWRANNWERSREIEKKCNDRINSTPKGRMLNSLRSCIRYSLKLNGEANSTGDVNRLPFTIKQLMAHLESLFTDGMTWDNYGKWEIDHKTPVCLFSFDTPHDPAFAECWALSNLQPLWARDNRVKHTQVQA